MFGALLPFLGNLIGGPIVKGLVDSYKAKLDAGNTAERIAADLAARELAVQEMEVKAQSQLKVAQIGHFWEPEKLFAYIIVIYFAKIVLWDKVLGSFLGYTPNAFNTDPLTGEAVGWAAMVMAFYFGKRGIENIARILKR
jgi:hypothetical protein